MIMIMEFYVDIVIKILFWISMLLKISILLLLASLNKGFINDFGYDQSVPAKQMQTEASGTSNTYTLLWHHNGRGGVSNHQPHVCLLNRVFIRRSKNTSKLHVTGLYVGNSPETGEVPAQMASNAENGSIWWRHHDMHNFVLICIIFAMDDSFLQSQGLFIEDIWFDYCVYYHWPLYVHVRVPLINWLSGKVIPIRPVSRNGTSDDLNREPTWSREM